MHLESFREYCLSKKGAAEETPFGPETLVFKVGGKIFALTSLDEPVFRCSLKCDPERAVELREQYDWIIPGYHLNKKHWNTLAPTSVAPDALVRELIDHSYELIVRSLPRKVQGEYL